MKFLIMLLYMFTTFGLATAVMAQSETHDQLPPLIDLEIFFGDPEIAGAQISPDGQFISFLKPYRDVINIWVKEIDASFEEARPVTADSLRPVTGYFWSRDSKMILYVQDKGGDENYHIYAVDPQAPAAEKTGVPDPLDLTPIDGIRAQIYSVPRNTPDSIIIGLNDRDPMYHDVYRVNLKTGERELLIENTEEIGVFFYDRNGSVRLALKQRPDGGNDILRVDGDQMTTVYSTTFEEMAYPIYFHPDGERVYMSTNKGEDVDLSRLVLFNLQTGEEEVLESDPENQVDLSGAEFSEVTDELLCTYYLGDKMRIYPKTESFAKDLEILREKLPDGEINFGSSTTDEKLQIIRVTRDVDPGSAYLYNRETGDVNFLYRSRPELPIEHLAPMKPVTYTARDGLKISAYLTTPKNIEAKNLPTVLMPHGGPWARDYWGYDPYAQFLANRGYAVLQPNFRGSTGYGKDFLNAGNKEWGIGAMQHDLTDAVKYLIDEGISDPKQIAIMGGSYGGYATLAGVTFTPDLFAAGIPIVAPSNLITLIESFPAYWRPFLVGSWYLRVGDPEKEADREDLIARSPLFHVDQIEVPLLVIHGANDPRVKKTESDQIVVALREKGHDVEYMVAPDEGHGFAGKMNRLASAAAMERFLAKHLDGRYQKEVSPELETHLTGLMVDVSTVKMPEVSQEAQDAETSPLPDMNMDALKPMTLEYKTVMEVPAHSFTIEGTRQIEKLVDRWRVVEQAESPMGASTDTLELALDTLRPLSHVVTQGPMVIRMEFTDEAITGSMKMGPREMPIDVKPEHPIFCDTSALEVMVAALPLSADYETTVRILNMQSQKANPYKLHVVGSDTVDVPAGSFQAYTIKTEPLSDEGSGQTFFVRQDGPPVLLKSISAVPAQMGGGEIVKELVGLE